MKQILKLFSLLLLMALTFGCTEAQKEAVKAKLFDIAGTPAIGDYTNDVGIIASADMTTLNVDYTGLNIDEEISSFGNIQTSAFFYTDTEADGLYGSIDYTDSLSWNNTNNEMYYTFRTEPNMSHLPQYNAQYSTSNPADFFKFTTTLTESTDATTPLNIKKMVVTVTYYPDYQADNKTYTKCYLKANNNGYGPLTLTGYESAVDGIVRNYGDYSIS